MKTTGLTLAEALATGRPFKHRNWTSFLSKETTNKRDAVCVNDADYFEPVWQVQEEEKPPMRVFASRAVYGSDGESRENHLDLSLGISDESAASVWRCDVTESLAKALAPYIKKELGL